MKIEQASPNTIHLKFRQEKGDENYGNCLWGDITIDCDNYVFMAKTNCGSYGCCFYPPSYDESFINLLCRMSKEFFLYNISSRDVFDFAESKRRTYEAIRKNLGIKNAENVIERIERNLDIFCKKVASKSNFIISCFGLCDLCDLETRYIAEKYPDEAEMLAEIFDTEIKPYLKTLEKQAGIKLKPCPFCGGKNITITEEKLPFDDICCLIECEDCGAFVSFVDSVPNGERAWNCSRTESIINWNRRYGE